MNNELVFNIIPPMGIDIGVYYSDIVMQLVDIAVSKNVYVIESHPIISRIFEWCRWFDKTTIKVYPRPITVEINTSLYKNTMKIGDEIITFIQPETRCLSIDDSDIDNIVDDVI